MTAILISRVKEKNKDTLYLAADQRVSTDDYIVSDHNKKIFTYEPDDGHEYRRHYVTVGDVMPTDYLINKLEQLNSLEEIYTYMFENELFGKMKGNMTFYIVIEYPDKPVVLQIYKSDDTSGVVNCNLDELELSPIFDGSGGLALVSAYKAMNALYDAEHYVDPELSVRFTQEQFIKMSFRIAAKQVPTMNDNVTLIKIPIKKSVKAKGSK